MSEEAAVTDSEIPGSDAGGQGDPPGEAIGRAAEDAVKKGPDNGEDAGAEDSLAFQAALQADFASDRIEHGSLVKGTIVSIQDDVVLVAVGGKSEAVMDRAELEDEKVGDEIEAVVVELGQETRISRKLALGRRSQEALRQAHESGLPVEGKITGKNKGGYEVRVAGLRGFCPFSQMGLAPGQSQDEAIGKSFEFRILELSGNGRRLVLSRSVLLKAENDARARELRSKMQVGDVLTGRIRSVTSFGAFVDLGGVEGLIHVSAISRKRVDNPADVLKAGQEVKVKVTKIEKDGKRLSLSMKDLEENPWDRAAERYKPGDAFTGKVVRGADFGLFIEIEPGLEGLCHVSQLPRGGKLGDEAFGMAQEVSGWIKEVDASKKRISLSLREVASGDPWKGAADRFPVGTVVEGTVEKGVKFGVFVQLEPGLAGLIPLSELQLPKGADPGKAFEPGRKLSVKVLSVDPKARRISLSAKEAEMDVERKQYRSYMSSTSSSSASHAPSGTSAFADALKQALSKRR
ncbi:MAG: S1 RNA-binding domain-containing protein [Acidobacteriota bacterium]